MYKSRHTVRILYGGDILCMLCETPWSASKLKSQLGNASLINCKIEQENHDCCGVDTSEHVCCVRSITRCALAHWLVFLMRN